jgi:hypothetical protein
MSKTRQANKHWKVPTPIKVAIGLFGTICLVIAIVGSYVYFLCLLMKVIPYELVSGKEVLTLLGPI